MALPTLEKTWQHNVNQTVGSTSTVLADNRDLLLKLKNALIGFSNSPWTIWGSNDGAGNFGNGDNVDRWSTVSNLIWAASGNHSWIVLTQSGINTKTSVCIDLYATTSSFAATIVFSPVNGFGSANGGADGTATARPTATDGITIITTTNWGGSNVAFTGKLHVMLSNDGQCTRVAHCRSSACPMIWVFDKPKSSISQWSNPVYMILIANTSTTEVITYANLNDLSTYNFTKFGSDNVKLYFTSDAWVSAMAGENITVADDDTSEWLMEPIGLASDTVNHRGAHKGSVYDLWWSSTALSTGDTFPGDGSKTFAQFGDLIFPWDGTTPLIS